MGRYHIIAKLDTFLRNQPFTEESQVLYLLAEIRKVLDHAYDKKTDFTLLRFYSDWTLHTEKSRNLQNIEPIIDNIYNGVKQQIENLFIPPNTKIPIVSFYYMEDLRNEVADFFQKENLPDSLYKLDDYWVAFVKNLVRILADQPIVNPTKDVTCFTFLDAAPGCVLGRIDFAQPLSNKDGSYSFYNFGNAY